MTKYPKGRAGYAEAKEGRNLVIFFGIVSILVLLVLHVNMGELNDFIRPEVKATAGWSKVIGAILIAGSVAPLVIALNSASDSNKFRWAWIICLALGIFFSCGFFGNTY